MNKRKTRRISLIAAALLMLSLALAPCSLAAGADEIRAANSLYDLGLFRGAASNSDGTPVYELDRAPNRYEAVTMLVRLLGLESEALSGSWDTPFTDVAPWAAPYVGCAYAKGLTDGVSADSFGGALPVTAAQYITFVLRALGYVSGTDFEPAASYKLSDSLGLTNGEYASAASFTRGDAAVISLAALSVKTKSASSTLAGSLLSSGAVTQRALSRAGISAGTPASVRLTAEELYEKCSPAVFSIESLNENGEQFNSGSGFFISPAGVAVTNYHVIEFSHAARAVLSDGGDTHMITGVYNYSVEADWAVVQVAGAGFPYVDIYTGAISAGASVYAIGNPMGLKNSISEGIVSHTSRDIDGRAFIQTSAAISSGSSGGALLDTRGRVVGITSATVVDGQNLNLAVPISLVDTDVSGGLVSFESIIPHPTVKALSGGVEVTDITLAFGQTITLNIVHDLNSQGAMLTKNIEDESVISTRWGEWLDYYTVQFTLTGSSPGKSNVVITLSNAYGDDLTSVEFAVTVA